MAAVDGGTGRRRVAVLLGCMLALAAAGCGSSDDSDEKSPAATRVSVPADVRAAFQTADGAQTAAFEAAEVTIRAGRSASELVASQAGGRAARDAFFAFDEALREISFPPGLAPSVNALLSSLGTAVAAFDEQNSARDDAAFLALDAKTGPAVIAARSAMAALRTRLGLPSAAPAAPEPALEPEPQPATSQKALSPAYVRGSKVTKARAWRDDLLEVGKANASADAAQGSESFGIVEAWQAAFPFLADTGIRGLAVEAPASGVSGFTAISANDKEPESATNPILLGFAVKDASGVCAAGALYGAEAPGRPVRVTLPKGAPCTGDAARKAAIKAGLD